MDRESDEFRIGGVRARYTSIQLERSLRLSRTERTVDPYELCAEPSGPGRCASALFFPRGRTVVNPVCYVNAIRARPAGLLWLQ
jgi:hypothetical protein